MSIFKNSTVNQHYVSKTEQSFYARNINARGKNLALFSFDKISNLDVISSGREVKIFNNLSIDDLFTLSVEDKTKVRFNLENLMGYLEEGYKSAVEKAVNDCALKSEFGKPISFSIDDLKIIMSLKFLSRFRNPYFIQETLRQFKSEDFFMVLLHEQYFEALDLLNSCSEKNHRRMLSLSESYGVSLLEYKQWMSFLIAQLIRDDKSLIEKTVDQFFMAKEYTTLINIYKCHDDVMLLPDCGYVYSDTIYMFSITPSIFITFSLFTEKQMADSKHEFRRVISSDIKYKDLTEKRIDEMFNEFNAGIHIRDNPSQGFIDILNQCIKKQSKKSVFFNQENMPS